MKKGMAPEVGSFVELKARLLPPLSPLRPGSYDFSRDLFFQGIGASGFAMGAITIVEPPESGGLALRYAALMQSLRDAIDARIRSRLDGDERAIARGAAFCAWSYATAAMRVRIARAEDTALPH